MKILLSLLLIIFVLYPNPVNAYIIHYAVKPDPYKNMTFEEKYDPVRIVNAIMSLQETFPEGSPWSDDDLYFWFDVEEATGYGRVQGGGCAGFAMLASDTAFGPPEVTPVYKYYDKNKIRVGDYIRINNDRHSVIVIEDLQECCGVETFRIVEGNGYGHAVHYGRIINLLDQGFDYGFTRYPPDDSN